MDEPRQNPSLLSDSAANRDLLDFSPYINTLLDIVRDPNTRGPLTIGLFGSWGSGKTSLMQFVRNDLAGDQDRKFRLAWFDAWKYQKEESLWRALLLRVIDNLRDRDGAVVDITPEPRRSEIGRLEQRLYRDVEWEEKGGLTIDWQKFAQATATGAVKLSFAFVPGLATLTKAVEAAQGALGKAEGASDLLDAFHRDVIEHHQAQLRSIEQFQDEFAKLVKERIVDQGERLVVFVDDLDRCLPEKAIEVLEAIKLFLDVPGCIFLLGLDQDVIARGIEIKYREFITDKGDGKRLLVEGAQYLEKIIQLPFRLPKIEPKAMLPFVSGMAAFAEPRCADVFAEGLETNPRKVKRAINVFLFLSRLADKRGSSLQPIRLAKIVVIYHSHPELYEQLRLNPALLRDLEAYLRAQMVTPRETEKPIADVTERTAREIAAPIQTRLITDVLKRIMLLFADDESACFLKATYDELNSYFTLTRGAVADVSPVSSVASVASATLAFPAPSFITIPAGEFLMGTSDAEIAFMLETMSWMEKEEKGYFEREQPQRHVWLDKYSISKYPVTNNEYQIFVLETNYRVPSHWSTGMFDEDISSHPVVNVSWDDALVYCEWLTKKLHDANLLRMDQVIRLPTEAEWEKAASWNDARKVHSIYPWGDDWITARCNVNKSVGTTTPVGKYSPIGESFYGVADMVGNVWEWCSDSYDKNYYQQIVERNPTSVGSEVRALRGGSWNSARSDARCSARRGNQQTHRGYSLGFRVAVSSSAVGSES